MRVSAAANREIPGLVELYSTLVAALVIAASDGLQTQWLLDADVDHEAALTLLDRLLAP